jgi:septum formation topological specificity factor MinE
MSRSRKKGGQYESLETPAYFVNGSYAKSALSVIDRYQQSLEQPERTCVLQNERMVYRGEDPARGAGEKPVYIKLRSGQGWDQADAMKVKIKQICDEEHLTDGQLIKRVLDIINMPKGQGELGTSKKLRERLLKDICRYLNVDPKTVNEKIHKAMPAIFEGHAMTTGGWSMLGAALSFDSYAICMRARLECISPALKALRQQEQGHEKKMGVIERRVTFNV